MEAFEAFQKLSESEKLKFFEVFCNSSKANSTNNYHATSPTKSPEKSSLTFLLENLKSGQKNFCEGNSPDSNCEVGDQKKKQKTLDSWLIKRNDGLSYRNKSEESCQTKLQLGMKSNSGVNVNNVSETCSAPSELSVKNASPNSSIPSLLSENELPDSSIDTCSISNKSDSVVEGVLMSDAAETVEYVTEKYNLRRSKRKITKLSPIREHNTSPLKHFKNNSNNLVNDCVKDNVYNRTDRVKLNGQLEQPQTSDILSLSLNTGLTTTQNTCNHIEHIKENDCLNSNNYGVTLNNKMAYNLQIKRSDLKLQSSLEASSEIPNDSSDVVMCEKLNGQGADTVAENNNHVLSSQPNNEVFCKLYVDCANNGLNIMDILQDERIQNLLNNSELSDDGVVFLGSFKTNTEETLPVVHFHRSKTRLYERLLKLQEKE